LSTLSKIRILMSRMILCIISRRTIGHILFPIYLSLQIYPYLVPFPRYYQICQNSKRSYDVKHVPFLGLYHAYAISLLAKISLHTRFEMPLFCVFTYMIGLQIKKQPRSLKHALFGWFVIRCNICLGLRMQ